MICFNAPRPKEEDKTYPARTKYGLISVVIHEVGHNYFPMIVNNDERQWTWLDEGLNSYLQYLAEAEWEDKYPSRIGDPAKIVEYMTSDSHDPIMTNSESIVDLGGNAYHKVATALNILRESILGRERFDFAFKEYAQRWMFKRPMPADFFRTMEDASGTNLDWFWRGWFYTTDNVDVSIEGIKLYTVDTHNPDIEKPLFKHTQEQEPATLSAQRNKPLGMRVEEFPELLDFYNSHDEFAVPPSDKKAFETFVKQFEEDERKLFDPTTSFTPGAEKRRRLGHARDPGSRIFRRQKRGTAHARRNLAPQQLSGGKGNSHAQGDSFHHARPASGDSRCRPLQQRLAAQARAHEVPGLKGRPR